MSTELLFEDKLGGYNMIAFKIIEADTTTTEGIESASTIYKPYGKIHSSEYTGVKYFTGKEYDRSSSYDTGLYYFGARYYDAELGLFLTPDPAMQFPSPYLYTGGNPVNMTDPTGMNAFTELFNWEPDRKSYQGYNGQGGGFGSNTVGANQLANTFNRQYSAHHMESGLERFS